MIPENISCMHSHKLYLRVLRLLRSVLLGSMIDLPLYIVLPIYGTSAAKLGLNLLVAFDFFYYIKIYSV